MNTIITGATKGIGKALAIKFAAEGHHLAVCARNENDLAHLKSELIKLNPNIAVLTYVADISQKTEVESFAKAAISMFGHIDVLINNGGVFLPGATTEEADGTLEKMMNTNLYSAYHLTRAIVPFMTSSTKAHIFNMCSIASTTAYPNGGSYSISKFALLGYTKVLRQELKEKAIKVTAIMPGATWSDSWAGVDLPHERLMEAVDIADSVWSAYQLGKSAVVEEIVIRPQLGDL
jgi:short-subunit dehydrogenase